MATEQFGPLQKEGNLLPRFVNFRLFICPPPQFFFRYNDSTPPKKMSPLFGPSESFDCQTISVHGDILRMFLLFRMGFIWSLYHLFYYYYYLLPTIALLFTVFNGLRHVHTHTFVATDGIRNDIFFLEIWRIRFGNGSWKTDLLFPLFCCHTMGNMCKWRILVEFSLMMMDFRIFDVPVAMDVLFFSAGEIGRIGQDVNGDR